MKYMPIAKSVESSAPRSRVSAKFLEVNIQFKSMKTSFVAHQIFMSCSFESLDLTKISRAFSPNSRKNKSLKCKEKRGTNHSEVSSRDYSS